MKIKLCFVLLITMFSFVFSSSCSRFGKGSGDANVEEIVMDDLSAEEREKLLNSSGINLKDNKYLADNLSRVEITHDNNGIKIEKQFYNNLPNIKYIAIHTFGNGQKQIIVYGTNGSVKMFSDTMMGELIKATPDELTKEAPVYNNAETPPGGITIKSLPPVTTQAEPIQTPQQLPVQTEPSPQNANVEQPKEIKQETETKPQEQPIVKETPTSVASPQNLRGNLQLYPTKKKAKSEE